MSSLGQASRAGTYYERQAALELGNTTARDTCCTWQSIGVTCVTTTLSRSMMCAAFKLQDRDDDSTQAKLIIQGDNPDQAGAGYGYY